MLAIMGKEELPLKNELLRVLRLGLHLENDPAKRKN